MEGELHGGIYFLHNSIQDQFKEQLWIQQNIQATNMGLGMSVTAFSLDVQPRTRPELDSTNKTSVLSGLSFSLFTFSNASPSRTTSSKFLGTRWYNEIQLDSICTLMTPQPKPHDDLIQWFHVEKNMAKGRSICLLIPGSGIRMLERKE